LQTEDLSSAIVSLVLIQCIRENGITSEEIEKQTGIRKEVMDDLDIRITIRQYIRLWEYASYVIGDPSIAIHLRENYGNEATHFTNNLAINSSNGLEAIKNLRRYIKVVSEAIQIEIIELSSKVRLSYEVHTSITKNPWMPEHAFSQILNFSRSLIAPMFSPIEVRFAHPCPGNIRNYENHFNCRVLFSQKANTIEIRNEDLVIPLAHPNPHLHMILKKQAEHELENTGADQSVANQVQRVIVRQMASRNLSFGLVAKILGMSQTTLYRKLKAEATLYNTLLADIRKEFADTYIRDGMSVSEIAYLLGYSSASSFVTAFKHWFGESPGSYRTSMPE